MTDDSSYFCSPAVVSNQRFCAQDFVHRLQEKKKANMFLILPLLKIPAFLVLVLSNLLVGLALLITRGKQRIPFKWNYWCNFKRNQYQSLNSSKIHEIEIHIQPIKDLHHFSYQLCNQKAFQMSASNVIIPIHYFFSAIHPAPHTHIHTHTFIKTCWFLAISLLEWMTFNVHYFLCSNHAMIKAVDSVFFGFSSCSFFWLERNKFTC